MREGSSAPAGRAGPRERDGTSGPRQEAWYLLEILAVSAVAVAEPVLAAFGRAPQEFFAIGASWRTVLLFGLAVAFGPPLAVWIALLPTRIGGPSLRRHAQTVALGAFGALIALRVATAMTGNVALTVVIVAGLTAAGVGTYRRLSAARTFLHFAAVGPFVLLAVFLVASPMARFIFPVKPAKAAAATPTRASGTSPGSLVFVVLDELSTQTLLDADDRIDRDLYPNLAAFADRSTWYRDNTSVASFTRAAVPALLSGLRPTSPYASARQREENLFTLFAPTHDLNVHEFGTMLCPPSLCPRRGRSGGLYGEFRRALHLYRQKLLPGTVPARKDITDGMGPLARYRGDVVDEFIASLRPPGARPQLDFVHVLFPHVPWTRLPDGRTYADTFAPVGMQSFRWTDPFAATMSRRRLVLQLQYTDRRLGEIFDRLRALGRFDDSTIVVTADHGSSFTVGTPWRDITEASEEQVAWAPLLVKLPHQEAGRIDERDVEQVDVLPTVADAVGIGIPPQLDGHSLLQGPARTGDTKRFYLNVAERLPNTAGGSAPLRRDGYRRMLAAPPVVPDSERPDAVFRIDPYGDLIGKRIRDLHRGAPSPAHVEVDGLDRRRDPSDDLVPALLEGRMRPTGDQALLFAVDGRVAGWTRTTRGSGGSFQALLVPRFVAAGGDHLEVYSIEGRPEAVTLRPVALGG